MSLPAENLAEERVEAAKVVVTVNRREVTFAVRRVTGAQIKETAIREGVPIQVDFALFRVQHDNHLKPVPDGETLELHEHEQFRAVAPDDNSSPAR